MDIQTDRINVASVSTTGNMYGMQTILQMNKENGKEFKVGQIRDYPRFAKVVDFCLTLHVKLFHWI